MVIGVSTEEMAKVAEVGSGLYTWLTTPWDQGVKNRQELIKHGTGLYETWTKLAYQKPPSDFFGRILWTFGVIGQMILSVATFPAALGAFLLEESVQSAGMGAYMLASSKYYDVLDGYLDSYATMIDTSETAAKTLAGLSPITGGAVLIYMEAAKMSWNAFRIITDRKLIEEAATDEKLRNKLLDDNKYGTIHLASVPTGAKIILDGVDLEVETPETLKKLNKGYHNFILRKVKASTGQTWEFTLRIEVAAGKKKEITINLAETTPGSKTTGSVSETPAAPKLPTFLEVTVTTDHIIDGDTFVTTSGEHVRLLGINAPEIGMPYADLATALLTKKIADKQVTLKIQTVVPIDTYGRTLAMVYVGAANICVAMVAAGLAKADIFPDAQYNPTAILNAEKLARMRRIGIWSEIP